VEIRDKAFIVGVLFFVIIWIGTAIYNKNVCTPEWVTIEENLEYIKKPNSIERIELYKAYDYPQTNLIDDTTEITDPCDIEFIQRMINNRYTGTWNRPTPSWSVGMKLILDNKKAIDFKISKISNDKNPDVTHLYFGSAHCRYGFPNCSDTLGNFLENLTLYNGVNY